jgi:hypothetical protein
MESAPVSKKPPGKLMIFLNGIMEAGLSERGRFLLGASPVVVIFIITEWLLLSNADSFVKTLNFVGVIIVTLLGGIFPVLLLYASRRKGECLPGRVYRFLGHPVVTIPIYFLSLANLILHGLVIWQDPFERLTALATAMLILWTSYRIIRTGAFKPRGVFELRQDHNQAGRVIFNNLASGEPAPLRLRLDDGQREDFIQTSSSEIPSFSSLVSIDFHLPETRIKELKVWAHQITPEGDSLSLPAVMEVHAGDEIQHYNLEANHGQVVIPLDIKLPNDPISFTIFLHAGKNVHKEREELDLKNR